MTHDFADAARPPGPAWPGPFAAVPSEATQVTVWPVPFVLTR